MGTMDTAWLNDRRKELGLTQKDLARAINKERSAGNRICRGKRPVYLDEIEAVADLLQVSRPEMLRRAGLELARSRTKRDAISLIDGMNDDEVRRLIPLLDKVAELVRKTGS